MKIAVVGSREFVQLKLVEYFVRDLPQGVTVISGGARGVDSAAAETARKVGLNVVEYLPNLEGCNERHEYTRRYYERNQKIVDDADLVVAFTEKDHGGTWDTIKRAVKVNKPVKIIRPSLFFPGEAESSKEDEEEGKGEHEERQIGKGPFQIKRVSLGSYALRLKRYLPPEEWAAFIVDKEEHPEALADRIAPYFIHFFESNNRFGTVHAITMAPRSIRNQHKPHVMEFVCQLVAGHFGFEYVPMFAPWDKRSRGRFAAHPEIEVLPGVEKWIGKVVFVLDDVSTTNYTLQASVKALTALEIHTHGVCYLMAH
jgi:hypothetical protein